MDYKSAYCKIQIDDEAGSQIFLIIGDTIIPQYLEILENRKIWSHSEAEHSRQQQRMRLWKEEEDAFSRTLSKFHLCCLTHSRPLTNHQSVRRIAWSQKAELYRYCVESVSGNSKHNNLRQCHKERN